MPKIETDKKAKSLDSKKPRLVELVNLSKLTTDELVELGVQIARLS